MSWAWRRGEASSQWHQGLVQKVVSLNTIAIRSREIALVIGALMHVRPNVFNCLWRYLCGEPSQLSVWNVISKSITRGMLLAPNWFLQVRIPGETLQWNHPNDWYKLFCQYTAAAILSPTSYTFFQLHSWSPANFLDIIDTLLPVGDQITVHKCISSSLLVLCSESPCSSPYLLQSLANAWWSTIWFGWWIHDDSYWIAQGDKGLRLACTNLVLAWSSIMRQ